MNKSRKFGAFTAIVFLLTVISGSSRVFAQVDDDKNGNPRIFSVGVLAGGNFCQVDGDNFAGYYKTALNVGGIAYAKVRKNTALSFELLYSQKGAKSRYGRYSPDSAIYIDKYSSNLNYAEIPVMINFFDKHRSHVGIGASYGRLLNSSESASLYPATVAPVDFNKYPFNKNDFQLIGGAQLHMWKGLFLNLRFQYSLVPIRTSIPPGLARSSQYNNIWTFRLMYLFI